MAAKTDEILTTVLGAILFVLVLLGTLLGIAVTHGFVLSVLWGWFLVPLGIPTLGIVQAMGFALVARYLTFHHTNCTKDEEENPASKLFARIFIHPLAILLVGWFIHLFL